MAYKQIGVTALRGPNGEFLPSQPLYIKVPDEDLNPETGMLPQEEKTLNDVAKIFADKMRQYVEGCREAGINIDL